jgi:hypothetical protein
MSTSLSVKCPACGGVRAIVFDHVASQVVAHCATCSLPRTMTDSPTTVALAAEVERLRSVLQIIASYDKDGDNNSAQIARQALAPGRRKGSSS